jgi:hypothetical protein
LSSLEPNAIKHAGTRELWYVYEVTRSLLRVPFACMLRQSAMAAQNIGKFVPRTAGAWCASWKSLKRDTAPNRAYIETARAKYTSAHCSLMRWS